MNMCHFKTCVTHVPAAVQQVYGWVHRDEDRSRARLEELGLLLHWRLLISLIFHCSKMPEASGVLCG